MPICYIVGGPSYHFCYERDKVCLKDYSNYSELMNLKNYVALKLIGEGMCCFII